MCDLRRRFFRPSLLLLAAAALAQAAVKNDFSYYPKNAQTCLGSASDSSGCTGNTVQAMNSCLCSNGGNFISNTAKCLGSSDKSDVLAVYDQLASSCKGSNTPINVKKADFFSSAGMSSVTTSAATTSRTASSTGTMVTTTSTATPTSTDTAQETQANPAPTSSGSGGLSGKALAGIVAGTVSTVVLAIGIAAYFLIRRRKRRQGQESYSMIANKHASFSGPGKGSSPLPSSAEFTALAPEGDDEDWPRDTKWRPSQGSENTSTPGQFNWETPYDPAPSPGFKAPSVTTEDTAWTGTATPPPVARTPSTRSITHVHELQGSPRPVEIAGTPILGSRPSSAYSGEDWGGELGKK